VVELEVDVASVGLAEGGVVVVWDAWGGDEEVKSDKEEVRDQSSVISLVGSEVDVVVEEVGVCCSCSFWSFGDFLLAVLLSPFFFLTSLTPPIPSLFFWNAGGIGCIGDVLIPNVRL